MTTSGEHRPSTEELAATAGPEESSGTAGRPPEYPGEATGDGHAPAPGRDREDVAAEARRERHEAAEARREQDEADAREAAFEEGRDGPDDGPDDGPKAVGATAGDDGAGPRMALLDGDRAEEFRHNWGDIQGRFVDDPRGAVRDADTLVAEVMQTLAGTFADHKQELEGRWRQGEEAPTEDLRLALRSYRSFFDRLLRT
ncbi:hypothetical protein LG634_01620 [Streptomyces bambusae]|uniref:hypothetical protein n=1 Tax=Streptomyces bambusae TaxID=1550616 RepID=UPI001CFCBF99|nr:hypothetical protein [Streptomyces bambusae]MCB5163548.1 hypothetical protein [Streptomyces bambusae]